MPAMTHTKAAEAQEAAAKSHHAAAELHKKGDHKAGADMAEKTLKLSDTAHVQSKAANDKSKSSAH